MARTEVRNSEVLSREATEKGMAILIEELCSGNITLMCFGRLESLADALLLESNPLHCELLIEKCSLLLCEHIHKSLLSMLLSGSFPDAFEFLTNLLRAE